MTDRHYIENRAWEDANENYEARVKMKEMADGTYAPAVYDETAETLLITLRDYLAPAKAQVVTGSTATTIANATQFVGLVPTTAVATATVSVYDNTAATGTPIAILSIAAIGPQTLPAPVKVNTGLTVKASLTGGTFTVLYR